MFFSVGGRTRVGANLTQVIKSEAEIMAIVGVHNPLPDMATQHHLLDLYWAYVRHLLPRTISDAFLRSILTTPSCTSRGSSDSTKLAC